MKTSTPELLQRFPAGSVMLRSGLCCVYSICSCCCSALLSLSSSSHTDHSHFKPSQHTERPAQAQLAPLCFPCGNPMFHSIALSRGNLIQVSPLNELFGQNSPIFRLEALIEIIVHVIYTR